VRRSPVRCSPDRPAEPRPQVHPGAYRLRLRGPFGAKAKNEKHQIWTIWEWCLLLFFVC
jgi:hypothetical protein